MCIYILKTKSNIYIYLFAIYIVFIYACLFTISWQFHCMLLSCFIL